MSASVLEYRIVKTTRIGSTKPIFAVRYEIDGQEYEFAARQTREQCLRDIEQMQSYSGPMASLYAPVMAAAMQRIWPLAASISQSEDNQGVANYATKSHMRAWANEILNVIALCYDQIGAQDGAFTQGQDSVGEQEGGHDRA